MNPDKKRKSDSADEEEDMQNKLYQASSNKSFETIMATDCTDRKRIQKVFDRMEPFAAGLLRQRFVNMETQFNKDKEAFEAKMRENEKVKKVIASFETVSPTPAPSAVVASSSSGGGGGGGGGILSGIFGSN